MSKVHGGGALGGDPGGVGGTGDDDGGGDGGGDRGLGGGGGQGDGDGDTGGEVGSGGEDGGGSHRPESPPIRNCLLKLQYPEITPVSLTSKLPSRYPFEVGMKACTPFAACVGERLYTSTGSLNLPIAVEVKRTAPDWNSSTMMFDAGSEPSPARKGVLYTLNLERVKTSAT